MPRIAADHAIPSRPVLIRVVLASARRPWLVMLLGLLLAVGSAWLAAARLQVTTDIDGLFAATLPWKQREAELKRLFPQFDDLLVAVVEADAPEMADATAAGLAAALQADPAHFRTVRRPDASPFFAQEGFLLLDRPVLQSLLDQTIDAQPFLGQLVADPSARGLFSALSLVARGVEQGVSLRAFEAPLRGFHAALSAAAAGDPVPLSWQRLLAGKVAELGGPYRFVLAQPVLDYGALQPGAAATAALRFAAAGQEFVAAGQARVRVTGSVALADEEFATVAQGAAAGLAGSLVLVVAWLAFAVRSWRLIAPIVLTLFLGLLLTTGFATLTSNPLNLISVAFAILFVGIAVDFAIQFCVRLRAAQVHAADLPDALADTAQEAGGQILVAAAATAAGFLAFVPTDFTGVAELGLIAGAGMLIAFACTLGFLPAALVAFRPRAAARDVGFEALRPLDRAIERRRRPVLAAFGLLAALGAAALPRLQFDSDPLSTKDPSTEAMRTLADLAANPLTNPYTIDILAPGPAAAADIAARVAALPLVGQVITLGSFVPGEQAEKLALIADAAGLLGPTLAPRSPAAPVSPADMRLAARTALSQMDRAVPRLPADHPLVEVAADLRALAVAPDATVMAANDALTRFLPDQIGRLRLALSAGPVTLDSLPPEIARDWRLPDGRVRVQVAARPESAGHAGLRAFAEQVQEAAPEAGGSAVTIAATARTIIGAFERAAAGALLAITLILFAALRRLRDVLLVLAPLLLSGLLTVLAAVLLPLPLNFANIIALPLLLGVGVSFNIYFVMNWRNGQRGHLASPTARAVVFSALTTGTAFGSLALSRHPGTASMGMLLLLSLGCTLLASLVFVPALLATMPPQTCSLPPQSCR
jgi:hopanoid biosynthesis associated RND transporter like protein HpnN